jgi:hypothetical protein
MKNQNSDSVSQQGHERTVLGLAANRFDNCVCSVSKDFTARLWDIEMGRFALKLSMHICNMIAPQRWYFHDNFHVVSARAPAYQFARV